MSTKQLYIEKIDDYDAEATRFLREYHYGDFAEYPSSVPINIIAEEMGLQLIDSFRLSLNQSIRGFITFMDGTVTVYSEENRPIEYHHESGMIFVDSRLPNNVKRNVIAHECFHWYSHRDFFIEQYHLANTRNFSESADANKKDTTPYWVERQAREMAPKILMPYKAAKWLLESFLNSKGELKAPIHVVIYYFSNIFEVSKQSACIRLKELDVQEAKEYYERVYSTPKDPLCGGIYWIPQKEALQLFLENDEFYELITSGLYCYTDDCFVVKNDPKYLAIEDGNRYVTKYAIEHPNDSFLPLQKYLFTKEMLASLGVAFSAYGKTWGTVFNSITGFGGITTSSTSDITLRLQQLRASLNKPRNRSQTPGAILWDHISSVKWSLKDFQDATHLGKNTFDRIKQAGIEAKRKDADPNYEEKEITFSFETIMTVCCGLKLGTSDVNAVLENTNYALKPSSPQHRAYGFCFDYCQTFDIDDCNTLLTSVGLKPFATKKKLSSDSWDNLSEQE